MQVYRLDLETLAISEVEAERTSPNYVWLSVSLSSGQEEVLKWKRETDTAAYFDTVGELRAVQKMHADNRYESVMQEIENLQVEADRLQAIALETLARA